MSVVAGGGHDDDTAFLTCGFRGGHALNGLIDVLIQRIAVVGGEDDICRYFFAQAQVLQECSAGQMCLLTVASKSTNHFVLRVNDHVADEGQLGYTGGIDHVTVDGISIQNTRAGEGAGDELRVVIPEHRFRGGDAGQHALASAGETGKEVGLNETLADQQVCFRRNAVDPKCSAGRQGADGDHGIFVRAVVNDEMFLFGNFRTEFFYQFCLCGAAVAACGDEKGDLGIGIAAADGCQHGRNENLTGDGTGMVTGDENDILFALHQFFQCLAADGIAESFLYQFTFTHGGNVVFQPAGEDCAHPLTRNVGMQMGTAVRNGDLHQKSSSQKQTLPGFRICLGSKTCLMPCISAMGVSPYWRFRKSFLA